MKDQPRERLPSFPKIIFMGTPDFAVPSLRALVEHGHNILAVVTQPDRPKGRGRNLTPSPVKRVATECNIEVLQPEKVSDKKFCDSIRVKTPDVLVVVAFGQILRKTLLEIPRWGVVNIHASILPKYRGAAPIQWAVLNNEAKTGLTAMRMEEGLDTGPILLQEETPISPKETAGQLHDRLARISGAFLLRTLDGVAKNRLMERPQDNNRATYAPKIDQRLTLIKWHQEAHVISGLIRAFDPRPGANTSVGGKQIKLFSPQVTDEDPQGLIPGRVAGYAEGCLHVETGKGVIKIGELQIPGRKRIPAADFLRGFPLDQGTLLGT
jgi:methionyl-tRNA formyltransferase